MGTQQPMAAPQTVPPQMAMPGAGMPMSAGPMPYGGPPQPSSYGEYCPPDWVQQYQQGSSPLGRRKVFEGGYVRTEYLNWNIGNPGDTLFGTRGS